jgi:peptide chain release factor 3
MLRPLDAIGDAIFAAVGKLQFEVMQYRLKDEYGVETVLSLLPYQCSAWILGDMKSFKKTTDSQIVHDKQERPIILFKSQWDKQYAVKLNPDHQLLDIS